MLSHSELVLIFHSRMRILPILDRHQRRQIRSKTTTGRLYLSRLLSERDDLRPAARRCRQRRAGSRPSSAAKGRAPSTERVRDTSLRNVKLALTFAGGTFRETAGGVSVSRASEWGLPICDRSQHPGFRFP